MRRVRRLLRPETLSVKDKLTVVVVRKSLITPNVRYALVLRRPSRMVSLLTPSKLRSPNSVRVCVMQWIERVMT
jgi:hypothetical protein